jgi:hypothetical protein
MRVPTGHQYKHGRFSRAPGAILDSRKKHDVRKGSALKWVALGRNQTLEKDRTVDIVGYERGRAPVYVLGTVLSISEGREARSTAHLRRTLGIPLRRNWTERRVLGAVPA